MPLLVADCARDRSAIWRPAALDKSSMGWHQSPTLTNPGRAHETVLSQALHVVERPDLRHAAVDVAIRRARGAGRAGQPLLSDGRWQDRSGSAFRASLGHL